MLKTSAWTTYTPTVSGWVLGNGTATGSYQKVGRMVTCRGQIAAGSTTNYVARLQTTVPVNATTIQWVFGGLLFDNSGGVFSPAMWRIGSTTSNNLEPFAMSTVTAINTAGLTSAIPWTWESANNADTVSWLLTYEASS